MKISTIVAATDFSEGADLAARRAATLASRDRTPLELLHIVSAEGLESLRDWVRDPPDAAERLVAGAQRLLDESAGALAGITGAKVTPRLVVGNVLDGIRAACGPESLLVVGAHGASTLGDVLLGTTAERLVRDCAGPVLVVRQPPREPYRNVIVGVDLQQDCPDLLSRAVRFAGDARITAVHAYEVPFESMLQRAGIQAAAVEGHRAGALNEALARIGELSEAASGDPNWVLPLVERGDPARLIVEHGRAVDADLLVVARRSRSLFETFLIGSVARRVVAEADRDVLVMPAPGASAA